MKKLLRLFIPLCALVIAVQAAAPPAGAQEAAKPAVPIILVIDVQRILRESKAAESVRDQLEARRTNLRDQFSKLEDDLRSAEQELARQRTVLSEEAFEEKRRAYETRVGEAQRMFDASRRDLDQAFSKALKEIQTAVLEVGQAVATERNADLVLARSQVMFVNKDYDVTESVLQRLDKKLPSVELEEPSEAGGAAAQPPITPAPELEMPAPAQGQKPPAPAPGQ